MPLVPNQLKTCSACKQRKPLDRFYKNKISKDGFYCQCKKCANKLNKSEAHKKAKKKYIGSEHGKRKARDTYFKRKYNITLEGYDKMFEQQNGLCAICGLPEIGRRLAVDHNHQTGEIRGLLCHQCNCCLGFIENKNIPIKNIQNYLKKGGN